ncbi:LOW QUALITY PROTEIN: class I histocompatibility antigen, F10 alpha chain-like [Pezoporus flaviventris]|uniref:LOW QUALITY PROTEIN: class I histocompatibility antigen, F10 alpha chain-like n=1 Tax=Pezoporus flaviventris TaxID=889875 RepID=UPI002AB10F7E|nr:LOW QUALITY PROTEIN: class I histocompatibility antigen, F10 alpha chain-like [Pezoporus flaviventris]
MGPDLAVGLLLLCSLGGAARVLHSLRYFEFAVSDPSPGVPRYQDMGYVDGSPFVRYDSESKRYQPRTQWIEANVDQEYWVEQTRIGQSNEQISYSNLNTVRDRYNQSGRAQTLQRMSGCDLLDDGSIKGYSEDTIDGQDFITFDMDTMTFIAADAAAQVTKRKWEHDGSVAEHQKNYLENTCVEWLKNYVRYGQLELERRVPPTVRVSGKETDGILTLTCRAHGFYPRPIVLSWLKDSEVRDQDTKWGSIAPNSDGTYYMWASIEASPRDKDRYRCQVEHASLLQPGLYALEPQSDLHSTLLVVAVVMLIIILITIGGVFWKRTLDKKKKDGYNMPPGMAMGSTT